MKPLSIVAGLALLASAASAAQDRITGAPFATRSEVLATGGMAATSQPLATQAALEILRAGGSAVDAAIAANAVLGLMEPTGCGIGGDLFAIVWSAEDEQLHGLNGSGRSPRSLTLEEFERRGLTSIPAYGPLPVSVPGCVDGWFTLHERFGQLPMEQVLAPAIHYATEGFPVSQTIAYYWQASARALHRYPGFREQMTIEGRGPAEGEIWRNENLARTYAALAEGGRDAFYEGDIARTIDAFMEEHGGFLSYEDLAAHRSEWVDPVGVAYRGHTLWELPPNGQGIAAQQILQVLEGFDIAAMGLGSERYLHLFIEAKKLAFEDRAKFYADPDFCEVPTEHLLSDEYADERRALIGERASRRLPAGLSEPPEEGDTIYLCTADAAGNMVSLIQSNYRGMGSGMTPTGLGFVLQDRGELFDLTPGRANSYAPGKRPFHTIIPAFLTREDGARMAFGVMGGATQPQMHAQIVIDLVDFGLGLQEAGDTPRMIHSGSSQPTGERMDDGGVVHMESGFSPDVARALLGRGHKLQAARGPYGGYQAIWRDPETGVLRGASESRKDGHAAGF